MKNIPKFQKPFKPLGLSQDNTTITQPINHSNMIRRTQEHEKYLREKHPNSNLSYGELAQLDRDINSKQQPVITNSPTRFETEQMKQNRLVYQQKVKENQENEITPEQYGQALGTLEFMGYATIPFDLYGLKPIVSQGIKHLGKKIVPKELPISRILNTQIKKTTLKEPLNLNMGWGPAQTIKVSHASDSQQPLQLFFNNTLPSNIIPIQINGKTKYVDLKPKRISKLELEGIPKNDRNQKQTLQDYNEHSLRYLYKGAAKDNKSLPYTQEDIEKASDFVAQNMIHSNKTEIENFGKKYTQILDRATDKNRLKELDEFNSLLQDYAKILPDPDEMFLNSNGFQSDYIRDFRKYLYYQGYDTKNIQDHELAKIITQQYKDLSNQMSGKTKGMVLWHGSNTHFDRFDLKNTSKNTGNMGYGGPGNYFSQHRALYGYDEKLQDVPNMQPYLINNIYSTPVFSIMQKKNLLPKYISPPSSTAEQIQRYKDIVQSLIEKTSINDNKLYIDNISMSPMGTLTGLTHPHRQEYMLRRNSGIKSLYPHPSLFKRDVNGNVSVIRDWTDERVNYKSGGKIKEKHN